MNVIGGTKSRSHQAERSISWSRRTCTAKEGRSRINLKIHPITGMNTIATVNNTNHQYSDRDALPLKLMYLLKHVLIDSAKVKTLTLSWI